MINNAASNEERLAINLKELYGSYGYKRYKLSSFEEYSLYLNNKDFLLSQNIISFNGTDGKLWALRPDVTLSILKSADGSLSNNEKLYYDENIYRSSKSYGYREIKQVGVELLGKVDIASISEICLLALKSLKIAGENFYLDLSHIGVIEGIFDYLNVNGAKRENLYEFLKNKNVHDFKLFADKNGISAEKCEVFEKLIKINGSIAEAIVSAEEIAVNERTKIAVAEIKAVYNTLSKLRYSDRLQLDFSIVNNADYYNGIIFNGYLSGQPKTVLIGGQYDGLVKKFGKECGALGFAVYLSLIDGGSETTTVDCMIIYEDGADKDKLFYEAEKLRKNNKTVRISPTEKTNVKSKTIFRFDNKSGLTAINR